MKNFNVTLSRSYRVNIEAENEESARELAEYFIGNPSDESTEKERAEHKFKIHEIEMLLNEAVEASLL